MIDSSFDEFVHAQVGALHRYALVLTGDRHAAEDLLQDTLVRMAGAWRRVHEDGNPVGYATTVMFRTHISLWRLRRRRPATVALTIDPMAADDGFASVEARLVLRQALALLPRLQHAVLVATYLQDHTDDEIAHMIGRSTSTVRSLRHRGLRTLHRELGKDIDKEVNHATPGISAAQ